VPVHLGVAARVTVLIGRGGRVAKAYRDVDPGVHATQILTDAAALRPRTRAAAAGAGGQRQRYGSVPPSPR
jgi:thioredoxin-dependent peroxiredoxin